MERGVTRVVGNEKEKKYWRVGEVELSELEKMMYRSMLSRSIGVKSLSDLKELGDVKANKYGMCVEVELSKEKRLSMLFGRKYNAYEYRSELFFKIEGEEK